MTSRGLPHGARDRDPGLVVVDKPAGDSSHDAVARVRRALRGVRAGHLGTLDPFATGVLPILLGTATRLAPWYRHLPKRYEATIALGAETDTLDATGQVTRRAPCDHVGEVSLRAAVAALVGTHEQEPPMFSARKVGGKRLYEHAREGREVARPRRTIQVLQAALLSFDASHATVRVDVEVSAGTYVRVLAAELGRSVGTAAHLAALRRTEVGRFTLDAAVTLEPDGLAERLRSARILAGDLLPELAVVQLDAAGTQEVQHGRPVALAAGAVAEGATVRLIGPDGELWALAVVTATGQAQPRLVLRAI